MVVIAGAMLVLILFAMHKSPIWAFKGSVWSLKTRGFDSNRKNVEGKSASSRDV